MSTRSTAMQCFAFPARQTIPSSLTKRAPLCCPTKPAYRALDRPHLTPAAISTPMSGNPAGNDEPSQDKVKSLTNPSTPPEDLDGFVLEEDEDEDTATPTQEYTTAMQSRLSAVLLSGHAKLTDLLIFATLIALLTLLAFITSTGFVVPYAAIQIHTSLSYLPLYALQSIGRVFAAYILSLLFSLGYAYVAYRVPFAASVMMLVIDVLQSVPLFAFLPAVVLGLIALFPGARIGVELAAVFLLFTSMAWNMVLGFYQSLTTIPKELNEAADIFRISRWRRFFVIELPAGIVGLVWNSIISVAGGWFFLISIESFELGDRDFRLPGLGSFLAYAAQAGNMQTLTAGVLTVIAVIVLTDFFVWGPLIAWSDRYKYGSGSSQRAPQSPVLSMLNRSSTVRRFRQKYLDGMVEKFLSLGDERNSQAAIPAAQLKTESSVPKSKDKKASIIALVFTILRIALIAGFVCAVGFASYHGLVLLAGVPKATWILLLKGAALTFGRVVLALTLSLLWAVPVGVAIGRNPVLGAKVQPLVQIAASVPATALFPFILVGLQTLVQSAAGAPPINIASIALMTLGTMWYVLFNVIAGAQSIPNELFEVQAIYSDRKRSSSWLVARWQGLVQAIRRWRTLILPGIFPYLVTGVVAAVGGAWNASIVSEYVMHRGEVLSTEGLGAIVAGAAASGDYMVLLAATVVMSGMVVLTNRIVWAPLYRMAEERYRLM